MVRGKKTLHSKDSTHPCLGKCWIWVFSFSFIWSYMLYDHMIRQGSPIFTYIYIYIYILFVCAWFWPISNESWLSVCKTPMIQLFNGAIFTEYWWTTNVTSSSESGFLLLRMRLQPETLILRGELQLLLQHLFKASQGHSNQMVQRMRQLQHKMDLASQITVIEAYWRVLASVPPNVWLWNQKEIQR
jgi:hypothetical protein